ncbi:hypothetical protein H8D85_02200 [bacterium]|nr:hypothetical protein [bacterium]
MTYLRILKTKTLPKDTRWTVKWNGDSDDEVVEVKLIFNPKDYMKGLRARKLYNQKELIKILEYEKERRKTQ